MKKDSASLIEEWVNQNIPEKHREAVKQLFNFEDELNKKGKRNRKALTVALAALESSDILLRGDKRAELMAFITRKYKEGLEVFPESVPNAQTTPSTTEESKMRRVQTPPLTPRCKP